jgi:CheY-like chemotaxis protein
MKGIAVNTNKVADNNEFEIAGRILVVDDDRVTRAFHRTILSNQFDVETASSGEEAIKICHDRLPDLVLLDVVMAGIDGFETCRKLREFTDIPIVFATANESLSEHLKAFDAGGDDVITKPVVKEVLLRKIALDIQRHRAKKKLLNEKNSLQTMAMDFLSAIGENGILQQFMQASLTCSTPRELGEHLVTAIKNFGLECSILIRHDSESTILTSYGIPNDMEKIILEQSATMGRVFQFKKKLVVNYDRVSVIINNMPADNSEKSGRIRDDIAMLTEMTHTLCENVDMRQASMSRAEQLQVALSGAVMTIESLQNRGRNAQVDSRLLLQEMVDNVEKIYSWLGTSRSQEESISKIMLASVEKILTLLDETNTESNKDFEKILHSLDDGHVGGEVDLF